MILTCQAREWILHTAGKVLLIIGGIITALGIVMIVGGAASANLDPSDENYYSGKGGNTWIVPGDDFYGVYTSSSVDCESFTMSIKNADEVEMFTSSCDYNNADDLVDDDYIKGSASDCDAIGSSTSISITLNGEEKFEKSCEFNEEDDYLDNDFQRVGDIAWFIGGVEAGETVDISSNVKIYIVGDIDALGDAAGGFLAAAGGVLIAICGGVILLIGLILALTLKSKDPVMMQQGQMMGGQMMAGQMPMQQMPAQQMPAQTTAQPYEYEQK